MTRLHLHVSIDPSLDAEREAMARAIARFPVSLGWQITFTPQPGEGEGLDAEPLTSVHFLAVVLAVDIKAPMGWELLVARSAGLRPMAFVKRVGRTLAARAFHRDSRLDWAEYEAASDLEPLFQKELARRLVANPAGYGLTAVEWQTLQGFLESEQEAEPEVGGAWEGAGRGGVILSPGHDIPKGAVLLGRESDRREGDHE